MVQVVSNGWANTVHHPVVLMSLGERNEVISSPVVGRDHMAAMTTTDTRTQVRDQKPVPIGSRSAWVGRGRRRVWTVIAPPPGAAGS